MSAVARLGGRARRRPCRRRPARRQQRLAAQRDGGGGVGQGQDPGGARGGDLALGVPGDGVRDDAVLSPEFGEARP